MVRYARAFLFVAVVGIIAVAGVRFAQLGLMEMPNEQAAAVVQAASAQGDGFDSTLQWVIAGGYVLIFFGMMVEGPIVTAAAAFAASLGYFNIWAVLVLAIAGDLAVDSCLFWAGRMLRTKVVERYGHRVGLSSARIHRLERMLKAHPRKTIIAIKLTPLIPVPGLMLVGSSKVSFRTYATTCLSFIVPSVLLFSALGYYFGRAYGSVSQYLQNAEYFILFSIAAVLLVYWLYKKFTKRLSLTLQAV